MRFVRAQIFCLDKSKQREYLVVSFNLQITNGMMFYSKSCTNHCVFSVIILLREIIHNLKRIQLDCVYLCTLMRFLIMPRRLTSPISLYTVVLSGIFRQVSPSVFSVLFIQASLPSYDGLLAFRCPFGVYMMLHFTYHLGGKCTDIICAR